ncbi:hypothetical protein FLM48_04850 [Shewanella sp. Scap07]|uniref:type VI secretion system amidase effector protein Tae4 n=1 Tax=Shewanella sp. Scap07 TaxID=2589987 RepID=UPI0015B9A8ED|nr:type VI secretion system amidase effector protein Tae4 [Shewanella sp. Scap07]QLE84476.1 hypothetical protein FLM48_04850 [Shewanella sp. Scap07]
MKRPSLILARNAFKNIYDDIGKSVSSVGTKIGGNVDYNINMLTIEQGRFENACAIRMSYVLNTIGVKVPYLKGKTISGGRGNWYLYRVSDLIDFLYDTFGEPDTVVPSPSASKLENFRGILVVEVQGWGDASGHATIWNGINCSDECYFPLSHKAYLWALKS